MSPTKPPGKRGAKDDKSRGFALASALAPALADMKKQLEAQAAAKAAKPQAASAASSARAAPAAAGARARTPKVDAAEEEATFQRMMSGVVPIGGDKPTRVSAGVAPRGPEARARAAEDLAARARAEADEVHEKLRQLVDGPSSFEVVDDGRRVEGRRLELPPQTLRSLRRGAIAVDARLDLHGQAAAAAHDELARFLRERRGRGDRCVLVIHGKGDHSPGGVGVLRGEISAWLSQGRASEQVSAFATATTEDGGEGAVYVLLRRDLG